jgi:hypothetical protein
MYRKLEALIKELEDHFVNVDKQNSTVSAGNIGWHIEHSLLTIIAVTKSLTNTNAQNYKPTFSILKIGIFASKTIPRGKAKAPEKVRPQGETNVSILTERISDAMICISRLRQLNSNQYFEHPYFGHLKRDQAVKFLEIHTKHHLKIIRDIVV